MGLFRIPFAVKVADIDESMDANAEAASEVARVSRLKATAVECGADDVVIAADTIVVCDGKILGKPRDVADAHRMLRSLSGRTHQVVSGIAVVAGDTCLTDTVITHVEMRAISDAEIEAYVRRDQPLDKAGAYGIQEAAGLFVTGIRGDYYNVVGLPLCRLGELLTAVGFPLFKESV